MKNNLVFKGFTEIFVKKFNLQQQKLIICITNKIINSIPVFKSNVQLLMPIIIMMRLVLINLNTLEYIPGLRVRHRNLFKITSNY